MFVALIKVVIVTKFTTKLVIVTKFATKVVIVTKFATKLVKMPPSLRILESREKKCVERLHDLKEEALTAGAEELGTLKFDLSLYLKSLTDAKDEETEEMEEKQVM